MMARGRLVVFGSYDAALHPRVAVLRDGLAAHGWAVEEVNAPLGASTSDKVAAAGSVSAALRLVGRQARSWGHLVRASRGRPAPEVVLVGYLGHADVHLARWCHPSATIALDHLVGLADTVRDRGLAGGLRLRALDLVDRAAVCAADVVVVDTELQAGMLPDSARGRAVVAPVGAQEQWRAAGRRAAGRPPGPGPEQDRPGRQDPVPSPMGGVGGPAERRPAALRVVFFGLYTPLQGAPTIGAAIALLRGEPIEFTMIGHGQDLAETRALAEGNPHVRWLDWVDPDELPALVAENEVCLGVFGTGPKAQRVVPTKVYQGMAAGCAVITGDTPAAGTLGSAVIRVAPGDPHALAGALRQLASDKESRTVARHRARKAAEQFTPEASTRALDDRLAQAPGRRAALPPLTFNAHLRWDVISRALEGAQVHEVLEIGPGEGAAACRLAPGRAYTGVELSDRTRAITAARLAALGTPGRLVAALADLDEQERFDLVCAFEVIEHIDHDADALAQWAQRVAPGGLLILSTPAGPDRMGAADEIAGHFRRYSAGQLAAMAREVGLVDVQVVHVGYPVGYALEAVRNTVAARRLARADRARAHADAGGVVAAATEQSSSFLQPPSWSGRATALASAPGVWLQRRRPDRGTGLVLIGRAPR